VEWVPWGWEGHSSQEGCDIETFLDIFAQITNTTSENEMFANSLKNRISAFGICNRTSSKVVSILSLYLKFLCHKDTGNIPYLRLINQGK
jgi:hypothetical protein